LKEKESPTKKQKVEEKAPEKPKTVEKKSVTAKSIQKTPPVKPQKKGKIIVTSY
jgi:hypothetical protein